MKQIAPIILALLFSTGISVGQNRTIDSLKVDIQSEREDTSKVNTLIALSNELVNVGDTIGMKYARDARELAEKTGFKIGVGRALHVIGRAYYAKGNYEEALKEFLMSLKVKEGIRDQRGMADSYNSIGLIYQFQGSYPEAMKNYLLALNIYEQLGNNKRGVANVYMNIGSVNLYQNNYSEALKNYSQSLLMMEQIGNKRGMALNYSNIGVVYHYQQNNDLALKNHLEALKINLEIGDVEHIAMNYNNIGLCYKDQGNYPEALKNYFESLKTSEKNGNNYNTANVYLNIGNIYTMQKKFKDAQEYLNRSVGLSKQIGSRNTLMQCYYSMAELADTIHNYKIAYEFYKMSSDIKDSLLNESNNKVIAEMKTKYETEKKDKEIKLQEAEIKKQKLIKYGAFSFAALIIIMGFVFFNNMRIRYKAKQIAQQNEIRQKISRDLHDEIGSGLTIISMICEKAEVKAENKQEDITVLDLSEKIKIQSRMVSEKLREVVWATNPENDNVEVLLSYIRNYVSKYFDNSSVVYSLDLPDNVPWLNMAPDVSRNLIFIMKEALNNCIKHSKATQIQILFRVNSDKSYRFNINDNGKGVDNKPPSSQYYGLRNMRKRIEEIGGRFEIISENGKGTQIEVSGSLV